MLTRQCLCGDTEVFKWISAYLSDETPVMDKDGYAWMLHGDMGEDNTTPKTLTKKNQLKVNGLNQVLI